MASPVLRFSTSSVPTPATALISTTAVRSAVASSCWTSANTSARAGRIRVLSAAADRSKPPPPANHQHERRQGDHLARHPGRAPLQNRAPGQQLVARVQEGLNNFLRDDTAHRRRPWPRLRQRSRRAGSCQRAFASAKRWGRPLPVGQASHKVRPVNPSPRTRLPFPWRRQRDPGSLPVQATPYDPWGSLGRSVLAGSA